MAQEFVQVVMIPFPAQGHINPMMRLANRLVRLSDRVRITFVCSQRFVGAAMGLREDPSIEIVGIDKGTLDEGSWKGSARGIGAMEKATAGMEERVEDLIRRDLMMRGSTVVGCILSDAFMAWTQDMANRLGVPRIVLWAPNAAGCVVSVLLHKLVGEHLPVREKLAEKGNVLLPGFPGLGNLRLKDVPLTYHERNEDLLQQRLATFAMIKEAAGVVANTFEELEVEAIAGMRTLVANFWPVGPLLPASFFEEDVPGHSNGAVSGNAGAWEEDRDCLQWLDKQAPRSVVYISFGSIANLSAAQVEQLAMGLEASGAPFLWVIRRNLVEGLEGNFLEDFLQRTAGRGLVISWAPQLQVLRHPSIQTFLTHCGWNSTLEAICSGVPLLGWPCFAEQNLNCKFIVEEWKIGADFQSGTDGLIDSKEIARVIRAAVASDGQFRQNLTGLKEAARRAFHEGAGFTDLKKFLNI